MRKRIIFPLLSSLCLLFSCGGESSSSIDPSITTTSSSSSGASTSETVKVGFEENEHYELPQYIYEIPKGSDLDIEMTIKGKYVLTGLDYAESSFEITADGNAIVHLYQVLYSTIVSFTFDEMEATFVFHLNGGSFIKDGQGEEYRLPASTAYHARPNLDVGIDRIYRDGYTLIGWEDENGLVTGLGSRYTLPDKREIHFNALWRKWDSINNYYYRFVDDKVYLNGYKGPTDIDSLIIPGQVAGYPVYALCQGAISDLNLKELVLPHTLDVIEEWAFVNCQIDNLYIYDDLHDVNDESFYLSHIESCHILTSHQTRGLRNNPHEQFTETMDRLILYSGKKKMVYYSGCSGSYSVNTRVMESSFEGEYVFCNLGILGGTNGSGMFECIINHLEPGDILINGPEEMSKYQLMNDLDADSRFFEVFMGNWDNLSGINISIIPNFWSSFADFVFVQDTLTGEETFNARPKYYDENGDYAEVRPNSPDDADFNIEGVFMTEWVNETSCGRLNAYYQQIKAKGATPLFTFAPVNENAVNRLDPRSIAKGSYLRELHRFMTEAEIISDLDEAILPGRYFFDTDYHVTDEGREIRTARLINDLKAYLGQ